MHSKTLTYKDPKRYQWPLALLFGAFTGIFLGRALGLMQLARPTILAHADA